MRKSLLALCLAALLLLSGCGASPAKPETPAPTEVPVPTAAPAPTATPAPAVTPAPTEVPAVDAAAVRVEAEGIYRLYSFETEGDLALASETGEAAWVALRRGGTADYMGAAPDGDFREWRAMPYTVEADGTLRFETPEDFIAADMTAARPDADTLELSLSFSYGDGTGGGSTGVFKRVRMHEGAFEGRALTEAELAALNEDFTGMPFCTTVYACPEEIDWSSVCYDGAYIGVEPSETAMREYLDDGGWGELDIEAVQDRRLRELVWSSTLTSCDLADKALRSRWFSSSDGYYIFEHGDTNAIPVAFYAGEVDGELYKLSYMRSDWEHFVFDEVPYVLTAYIRDGVWQYVSNLPADWVAPRTLLTLRYASELDDVKTVDDLRDAVAPEELPSSEPTGRSWAVFTAQTDGVRYFVERVEDYTDMGWDVTIPGECLMSGVLDRGESAAILTNQPWHAEMRLTATCGAHYASYVFGEDNWKQLHDADERRLVGHDLSGEGRGCKPTSAETLSAFLCDGAWALLDASGDALAGCVEFHDYRYMAMQSEDFCLDAFLYFDRYDARPTEAPDLLCPEYSEGWGRTWGVEGYSERQALGDYRLWMVQLDCEQVLTLTQVSEYEGVLSRLFPEADEGGVFTLHRWRGTAELEGQG